MPLNDHLPVIDDRRYGDILEELRTRIPRYTPEWKGWTDLNDSDPGITFSQLVAWLTEMMIHRMSKVPELNYLKFLELLGIELRSAQPARAEIEFPVQETHAAPFVIVRPRTQVSADDEAGGPPIIFETDRASYALTAQLFSVQAHDGSSFREVLSDNTTNTPYFPFGEAARPGAAVYLGFRYPTQYTGPQDFPKLTLDLAVWAESEQARGGSSLPCSPGRPSQYASATIMWESWDGTEWKTLDLIKDETLALTRSGHVLIQTPQEGILKQVKVGPAGTEHEGYFIRGRIERSAYERPPKVRSIQPNTIPATQAETVRDEVLGGSDGTRDQVFTLANRPVLPGTLRLEIDEGDGPKEWKQVDDLFSSNADETHYVLNSTTGEVRLGGLRFSDEIHGHVPVANVQSPGTNVVAREYRSGGGKRGNLKAGTLTTLVISITGIDDGKITNRFEGHSGREEETLAEAKMRARRSVRSRTRAVTTEDFEQLAQEAANVKRAKALPLIHPQFPDTPIPGVISVIIVPDSEAAQPMPSEGTIRTVCAYLNDRRLLTAEVFVLRPTYQLIEVRGTLIVEDQADLRDVKDAAEKAVTDYFHPLRGGEDGQGWPFGGTVFYSKVLHRMFQVPGVARIEQLELYVDGEKKPPCEDIDLRGYALTYSTDHRLSVRYNFEEVSP